MEVTLLTKNEITEDLQNQLSQLYLQLNAELKQLPLKKILEEKDYVDIAVCYEDNQLIGIAMMANYKVVSGYKGMIEDVIVSENYRGRGIGRKLMEVLLQQAEKRKLNDILLFSGHHRTAAINLYKSLGFSLKSSGLYIKKQN
ncbi:GNAT family N-acetyltransferase [Maribacter sp. PR1]|uniref:GNAT family N-acetyltransferase n=1 Tax=Maribacter cobaltidurans TaxID=1178778 RepID=A0ABU7IS30_9FLAO|nr:MULTISPECIES: GNAT family N-acetyltransferase [Maribacter]MDC6388371.1 GNAT family N-acetyltransferase [Maribacter sp. PR1]MEE1975760.1 GNAT family N-acetyltransferase [Maribacter cobaltidurans]